MKPLSIKRIESFIKENKKWDTNKLVFEIENNKKLDVISYLGEGLKSTKTLSFVNPVVMNQKELIVVFKPQSAAHGIHLIPSSHQPTKTVRKAAISPWMPSPPCLPTKRQLVLQSYHSQQPTYPSIQPKSQNWCPLEIYKNLRKQG
jgi:hypothetical protein